LTYEQLEDTNLDDIPYTGHYRRSGRVEKIKDETLDVAKKEASQTSIDPAEIEEDPDSGVSLETIESSTDDSNDDDEPG